MESIVEVITAAEREAAERKAQAQKEAAGIIAEAEVRAVEIIKAEEKDGAVRRENALRSAREEAEANYAAKTEETRLIAESYSENMKEIVDKSARKIVGRLLK